MQQRSTMWPRSTALLLCALMLAVVGLLPAAASAAPPFRTGFYSGKTSQGKTIKFRIKQTKCDAPTFPFRFHKAYCFIGVVANASLNAFFPTMLEPCTNSAPVFSDPLYAASYQLSLTDSGQLSFSVRGLGSSLTTNGSLTSLKLHVKHSSATGTLRQTESFDSGTGPTDCDSGRVSFTAHRIHG